MKKIRSIVLLLIALGFCLWLLTRNDSESRGGTARHLKNAVELGGPTQSGGEPWNPVGAVAKPRTDSKAEWSDIRWETIGEIMSGKAIGRALLTEAQVEAFLHNRGVTAPKLVAAWESTRERKWLEQALEQFPDNPMVLIAALEDAFAPKNRAELIERLKRAAPDNPLPWLYNADRLFKDGKRSEAIAELRESLKKPGFYVYSNERIASAQELLLDAGLDPIGGEFLAIAQLPLDHLYAAMRASRAIHEYAKDSTTSLESRREITALGYGLGRMFSTPEASRTALGQLVAISIESQALKLAQSIEENPLTVDPSVRLAELDRQKAEVREFAGLAQKILQSQDPALLTGYMQRLRKQGERNAFQWLKSQ